MGPVEEEEKTKPEIHPYDPVVVERQLERLNRVRRKRDESRIRSLLAELQQKAKDSSTNLMPITISLVKAGATMGDIVEALREIWGTYRETPVF